MSLYAHKLKLINFYKVTVCFPLGMSDVRKTSMGESDSHLTGLFVMVMLLFGSELLGIVVTTNLMEFAVPQRCDESFV